MVGQGGKFFLQMGSTVVLARLLTPEDYGLVAMVAVVSNFVMMFKDAGLSMATVQKDEINHAQISTLFWINVVISLMIMLVMVALSPVVAWFYGKPELTLVTLALAGSFIFSGLTIQHQALLRRQMYFGRLAVIEVAAMFCSVIAAIISAWYGAGYWALVIMQLVMAVSLAMGVWIVCDWRPGLPKRGTGVRPMLAFGGCLTGFSFVNYFSRNLDKLLIGKYCPTSELGYYSKAYQLLMLPINQIRGPIVNVATPALSRLQNDKEKYRSYYYRMVNTLAFLTMPLMVFLVVCSKDIVLTVLGDQWLDMCSIFLILSIVAFIQPVASTRGLVLISMGQGRKYLIWGGLNAVVVVVSVLVGIRWQAKGVAISYCVANYVILLPSLWYCFKGSPLGIQKFFISICGPALASVIMGLVIWYIKVSLTADYHIVPRLVIHFVLALLVYMTVLCIVPDWRRDLDACVKLVRYIKR